MFGRRLIKVESNRGVPCIRYKLTKDGQFDVERKKISSLADATSSSDAFYFILFYFILFHNKRDVPIIHSLQLI